MVDFQIRVVVDPSGAQAGARQVGRSLNRLEQTGRRVARSIGVAFAAAAFGAGITGSIRLLAEFEQEISTVAAVTGATREEMEQFSRVAQELGSSTRFSATQAAQGLTFLARAGFTVAESLAAVEDTLVLAQAGGLDLGRAADIASNALQGFGLEVAQLGRVVDVFALAANSSNTNVEQLGQALSFVAPVAAGLSVSLEETTAAIGALSNAGIQASRAGTGLSRVLAELESPSQATADILKELQLTEDDVRITTVGLTGALTALRDAGADAGTGLEIFGQRGGPAFAVLSSAIPDIEAMNIQLQNAAGTARRVAAVMDDNLNGALLRVRSAFEGLVIATGTTGGANAALIQELNTLAAALNFLAQNIRFVLDGLAFFVATVPVAIAAVKALGVAAAAGTTGLAALTSVAVGGPLLLFAAAAATATTALRRMLEISRDIQEADLLVGDFFGQNFTEFGAINAQVLQTEQRIRSLKEEFEETRESGGVVNPADENRLRNFEGLLVRLQAQLRVVNGEAAENARIAQEQADAQGRVNQAFGEATTELLREAEILQLSNREGEVRAELLQRIADIEEDGAGLNPGDAAVLEFNIRNNQLLRDRAAVLNELNGPQMEFEARLAAARDLFDAGTINAKQLEQVVMGLAEQFPEFELPDFEGLDPFTFDLGGIEAQNKALEERVRLLGFDSDARKIEIELARITQELQLQGIDLSSEENKEARESIRLQLEGIAALQARVDALDDIRGPQDEFIKKKQILEQLARDEIITDEELVEALMKLREAYDEVADGSDAAALAIKVFEGIAQEVADVVVESLGDAINTTGQALAAFVIANEDAGDAFEDLGDRLLETLRNLVSSLLEQLAILAAQQLLLELVGGGDTELGGLILGSRASGGPVSADGDFLVGERGPEIFSPSTSGTIVPAGETAAFMAGMEANGMAQAPVTVMAAPAQVQIVNVTDPKEIQDGIESAAGQQSIMNVIRRRRREIGSTLPRN